MVNKKLYDEITNLTERLREEKPELHKMLLENPITIPDQMHPDITEQTLKEYIITLKAFLSKPD